MTIAGPETGLASSALKKYSLCLERKQMTGLFLIRRCQESGLKPVAYSRRREVVDSAGIVASGPLQASVALQKQDWIGKSRSRRCVIKILICTLWPSCFISVQSHGGGF